MADPMAAPDSHAGPSGYSYAGVILRLGARSRDDVLDALHDLRFTGWVGPHEGEWLIMACSPGTVASGRRGVVQIGTWLADRFQASAVAVQVIDDRQLLLVFWDEGREAGRYISDPSYGLDEDDDTLPDPLGAERAADFAAACGVPEVAEDLAELLGEDLDPDSMIESERLASVLRILQMPTWLISSPSLPKDIPAGPRARDLIRLRAGVTGTRGRLRGLTAALVRKRRPPPPAITDAPRGGGDIEPWML